MTTIRADGPVVFDALRAKHPRFIYERYDALVNGVQLELTYHFTLEPGLYFTPRLTIPWPEHLAVQPFHDYLFHLGLIEMLSYWKVSCAPIIEIRAGHLDATELQFWRELIVRGLGEFYYRNGITADCAAPHFVITGQVTPRIAPESGSPPHGALVMLGGGKDSALMLELLAQDYTERMVPCALNPIPAVRRSLQIMSEERRNNAPLFSPLCALQRTIDPLLLQLNSEGYLNGHTPFSAYLAFLGSLVGEVQGLRHVVVANERSADEPNLQDSQEYVNHQYSKSFHFERAFREYAARRFGERVHYFSLIRPLYDLQVSRAFAHYPRQHRAFRSCNVGQKKDLWCGHCAKCAFVALTFAPFLEREQLQNIFSAPVLEHADIHQEIRALVGLTGLKPFECVGTSGESRVALALLVRRYSAKGWPIPVPLQALYNELPESRWCDAQLLEMCNAWGSEHSLPPEFERVVRRCVQN